jgi:hypothetical protein
MSREVMDMARPWVVQPEWKRTWEPSCAASAEDKYELDMLKSLGPHRSVAFAEAQSPQSRYGERYLRDGELCLFLFMTASDKTLSTL